MDRETFITELGDLMEESPDALQDQVQIRHLQNWDSMALLGLLAMADDKFQVQLKADSVAKCLTVGDIFQLLQDSEAERDAQQRLRSINEGIQ